MINVPEGMLKAAIAQALISGKVMNRRQWTEFFASADSICTRFTREILRAALQWLAENPVRPTQEQAAQLWKVALQLDPDRNEDTHAAVNLVLAWQRMMFVKPDVPERK